MLLIKGRKSYSKEIISKNLRELYGFIILILLLNVASLFFSYKKDRVFNSDTLIVLIFMSLGAAVCLLFILMFRVLNKYFNKKDKIINIARVGEAGERAVLNRLKKSLDDSYSVYPNFKIPGRKFDVDFLIIGPKGVIVMEVKNNSDYYIFTEEEVLKVRGSGYTREVTKLYGNSDPRVKLSNHSKSINYHLYSAGIKGVRVKKVLVFIDTKIKIIGKAGIYIVKNLGEIDKYLEGLRDDDRFTLEYCSIVNKKLQNAQKQT